jgi:hypothetical protein
MKKWILYIIVLGFSAYWASNLLLWFPWSYSSILGITLMLTLAPVLWAYVTFLGLQTYPKSNLLKAALSIAFIFLLMSVVMDYIFFGLIRNAMEDLYQPTTFYGYGFLIVWPILLALIFNKRLSQKRTLANPKIIKTAIYGLFFLVILTLIIILGIEI